MTNSFTCPRPLLRHTLAAGATALTLCLPTLASAQTLRPATQLSNAATVPANTAARPADFIVAVVNSEPITNNELRARVLRTEQQINQQGVTMPPRDTLKRQVLEQLIQEKIQVQMAQESGIKIDDEAVQAAEQNVARQNQVSVTDLQKRLAQDGIPLTQFHDELRTQLMQARLRERELEARVKVTEADIDQFLRDQRGGAEHAPQEINLAQVLIAVPEQATDAQVAALQTRATRVLQRAQSGEDFSALVQEFSDAPKGDQLGGQMGLRSADRYPQLFVDATQNLRVGDVSAIVRSGAGFHVLKLIERAEAGLTVTQSHARHILLRPSPQLPESAALSRLAEMRQRLLTGKADFATLAREFSQDGSAAQGGDLGWAGPGQFVPEFEEAMDHLAVNEISPPLVSRFGVHLIQVLERRQAQLSTKEQRELARNLVREKKQEEAFLTWTQDLRARAYVELRDAPQ